MFQSLSAPIELIILAAPLQTRLCHITRHDKLTHTGNLTTCSTRSCTRTPDSLHTPLSGWVLKRRVIVTSELQRATLKPGCLASVRFVPERLSLSQMTQCSHVTQAVAHVKSSTPQAEKQHNTLRIWPVSARFSCYISAIAFTATSIWYSQQLA